MKEHRHALAAPARARKVGSSPDCSPGAAGCHTCKTTNTLNLTTYMATKRREGKKALGMKTIFFHNSEAYLMFSPALAVYWGNHHFPGFLILADSRLMCAILRPLYRTNAKCTRLTWYPCHCSDTNIEASVIHPPCSYRGAQPSSRGAIRFFVNYFQSSQDKQNGIGPGNIN